MKLLMFAISGVIIFLLISGYTNTYSSKAEPTQEPVKKVELENDSDIAYDRVQQLIDDNANKAIAAAEGKGITPVTVEIPSIDVKAEIENVGVLKNGQMGVPAKDENVAWFEPGFQPGSTGNSVLAGHVDSKEGPAVFFHLDRLTKGDKVVVTDQNGKSLTFVVKGKKSFPYQNAPIEEIFGPSDTQNLNLITCTGNFNRSAGTHEERLVVFTELISE